MLKTLIQETDPEGFFFTCFKTSVVDARVIVRMAFRIAGYFVLITDTEFSFTLPCTLASNHILSFVTQGHL